MKTGSEKVLENVVDMLSEKGRKVKLQTQYSRGDVPRGIIGEHSYTTVIEKKGGFFKRLIHRGKVLASQLPEGSYGSPTEILYRVGDKQVQEILKKECSKFKKVNLTPTKYFKFNLFSGKLLPD